MFDEFTKFLAYRSSDAFWDHYIFDLGNYKVFVVKGPGKDGKWGMALMDRETEELVYPKGTIFEDDVIGHLDEANVNRMLTKILDNNFSDWDGIDI